MAIDETGLTKGLVRKLNALRKSVGDDLAEEVFAKWLEREAASQARSKPDPVAMKIIEPTFPIYHPNSWKSYHFPTAKGTVSPMQPSDGMILVIGPRLEGHSVIFLATRHTSPVAFSSPSIPSAYAGAGLRRRSSIKLRIFRNRSLGTATSANWNVT